MFKKMSSTPFGLPGITNPITHAGRVVYNASRDATEQHRRLSRARRGGAKTLYKETQHDNENFSIQPYELCLRNKDTKYVSYAPNDTDMYVFSSANGMAAPPISSFKGGDQLRAVINDDSVDVDKHISSCLINV